MGDSLEFLAAIFKGEKPTKPPGLSRPYVTLTFAQSLDAKIAGINGKQLILSGKESMVMTHWMRTMHDGIMVGIGTALNDDPQLNTRLLSQPRHKPRPIIVDSDLRLSIDCKLLNNYRDGNGRRPWILCSSKSVDSGKKKQLEDAGAKIIPVETDSSGLKIKSILETLDKLGIKTLMVEGGARIIGAFLQSAREEVDSVILTIAPMIVGQEGTGYHSPGVDNVEVVRTVQLGRDTVVGLNVIRAM